MQRRPRSIGPSLLALSLGCLPFIPAPLYGQALPIAGLWYYNAERSAQLEGRGPEDGARGGGPGGPRGRPRSGGSAEGSAQLGEFLRPVLQLLVRQDDSTVAVSDPAGQMRTVRTDGHTVKAYSKAGEQIETTARWKDSKLLIERKFGGAGSVKETYSLDPLTKELLVEVRVSGGMFPRAIEMRRVYDPAKGS